MAAAAATPKHRVTPDYQSCRYEAVMRGFYRSRAESSGIGQSSNASGVKESSGTDDNGPTWQRRGDTAESAM